VPTAVPTAVPTSSPTLSPTRSPTFNPTQSPTPVPTPPPTLLPTSSPTLSPTRSPTQSPSAVPSHSPTVSSTATPTLPPVSTPPTVDPWLIENTTAVVHDFHQMFVSHDINSGPRFAEVQFFEADCNTMLGEDDVISLSSGPFVYVSENITYTLNIDESQLESSNIVTFDDDARTSGTISFCTLVIAKSSSNLDVSSKKTKFNLNFDTSAEFTLDIGLSEQEVEQINVDISLSVFACECNADFDCIADVYELGDTAPEFRVCITPAVVGSSVSNLELTLSNDVYEYDPVTFGVSGPEPDAITTISESESTTMISTRLVANLFSNDNSFITVSGLVALDLGGTKDSDLERIELNVLVEKPTTVLHQENGGCLGFLRNLLKSNP